MDTRAPDWDYWGGQGSARVWECLALSVEVEPRELGVDHFLVMRSTETGSSLLSDSDPPWLAEICRRLGALYKALEDPPSGLRAGRKKAVSFDAELKLDGFAAWAKGRKWKLPKALRERAGTVTAGKGKKTRARASAKARR